MKIAPLFVASAAALETSSTAKNLLAAVGHRNVSHMEALVQGLADESVQVPAWKFDEDIRKALEAIRKVFVGNIQTALLEQHKVDQEHMNCDTETCFMGCINTYKKATKACNGATEECEGYNQGHVKCRAEVYSSYIKMAKSCSALHCFIINWEDEVCPDEECLCPDLTTCHLAVRHGGSYGADEVAVCEAKLGSCTGTYGTWLLSMISKFKAGYGSWVDFHGNCRTDYHHFLTVDMVCDATQKKFEKCLCTQRSCDETACSVEFEQCQEGCWNRYKQIIKEKECLEKDRKIDWSATKKIECFIDILLHEYTKEELLSKCGTAECVNVAREADYKHCHTICTHVDHDDGVWPTVHSWSLACPSDATAYASGKQYDSQTVWIGGHNFRKFHDEYHLGDTLYKCDANGEEVFTVHRGGAKDGKNIDRASEYRCTEHLDLDYQTPPCCDCDEPPPPVCDEAFHAKYYCEFDDSTLITGISDCCPTDCGATCFTPVTLQSVMTDAAVCTTTFNALSIQEHTHAWAFNRCQCTECQDSTPGYASTTYTCGAGAHTILGGGGGGGAYGVDAPMVGR
jgi:hypothetical protein